MLIDVQECARMNRSHTSTHCSFEQDILPALHPEKKLEGELKWLCVHHIQAKLCQHYYTDQVLWYQCLSM